MDTERIRYLLDISKTFSCKEKELAKLGRKVWKGNIARKAVYITWTHAKVC
jgi:hypothetical protein